MRYTVKSGETLLKIAQENGLTVDELMRLNPHIKDRNLVYAGRAVNLPDLPAASGARTDSLLPEAVLPEGKVRANAFSPLAAIPTPVIAGRPGDMSWRNLIYGV